MITAYFLLVVTQIFITVLNILNKSIYKKWVIKFWWKHIIHYMIPMGMCYFSSIRVGFGCLSTILQCVLSAFAYCQLEECAFVLSRDHSLLVRVLCVRKQSKWLFVYVQAVPSTDLTGILVNRGLGFDLSILGITLYDYIYGSRYTAIWYIWW